MALMEGELVGRRGPVVARCDTTIGVKDNWQPRMHGCMDAWIPGEHIECVVLQVQLRALPSAGHLCVLPCQCVDATHSPQASTHRLPLAPNLQQGKYVHV